MGGPGCRPGVKKTTEGEHRNASRKEWRAIKRPTGGGAKKQIDTVREWEGSGESKEGANQSNLWGREIKDNCGVCLNLKGSMVATKVEIDIS